MASIYRRNDSPFYWISFPPERGEAILRESLGTTKRRIAEEQRRKIEALQTIQKLAHIEIPASILARIVPGDAGVARHRVVSSSSPPSVEKPPRGTITEVLRGYLIRSAASNSLAHLADKISRLRQFFGSTILDEIDPRPLTPQRKKPPVVEAFFRGQFLDEVRPDDILEFLLERKYGRASKRHYREIMHGLFRHALVNGLYVPVNPYVPNPADELPGYAGNDEPIVVLSDEEVSRQYKIAASDQAVLTGCKVMVEAGLRLHEALALRKRDVDFDQRLLRLRLPERRSRRQEKLKTGERTITLREPLAAYLEQCVPSITSEYLVHSRRGDSWNSHDYAEALREINRRAGVPWTTQDFRHTYATSRLREGWHLSTLCREMSTSLGMLEEHYAGYIAPPMAASLAAKR